MPKGKFILKNNSLESWSCFCLFLWRTQNYNFVAPLSLSRVSINQRHPSGLGLSLTTQRKSISHSRFQQIFTLSKAAMETLEEIDVKYVES